MPRRRSCRLQHVCTMAQVFNVTGRAHPAEAEIPRIVGGSAAAGPPPQRIMQKASFGNIPNRLLGLIVVDCISLGQHKVAAL